MSALKEVIQRLPNKDKQQLMYALEEEFAHWIKLPNNKFVGVNVKGLPQLNIQESIGSWAYGDIK